MTTLMLPAPARFKVSKAIRLPDIQHLARQRDFYNNMIRAYGDRDGNWGRAVKDYEAQLHYAEFVHEYVRQHDCNPRILEKGVDKNWGRRWAKIQIEDSIYRVSVSMGRRARGMYGKDGHEWNLAIARDGGRIESYRVEKSTGLGSTALREHLAWKYNLSRQRIKR